jgi:hypothetical protein
MDAPTPMDAAYEIAKAHAVVDGAYSEALTRHWFAAAWDLCAQAVGLVPPRQVTETVFPNQRDGTVQLAGKPTSEVRLYSSDGTLVAVLPPNAPQLNGHNNLPNPFDHRDIDSIACMPPSLCCYCMLTAQYNVGQAIGPCDAFSPAFVQAVCQLFAFMVENRGDVKLDDQVLTRSGAKGWLSGGLTYIA